MQWELLWYSAPSNLNNDLLNDGVMLDVHNRVVDTAIETFFKFPFSQTQTRRYFGCTKIDAGDTDEQMGVEAGTRDDWMGLRRETWLVAWKRSRRPED